MQQTKPAATGQRVVMIAVFLSKPSCTLLPVQTEARERVCRMRLIG